MSRPGAVGRSPLVVVAVVLLAVQCAVLYWPAPPPVGGGLPGLDKVAHLVVFALPTWALARLLRTRWAVLLMAGHAVVSELDQGALLANRQADPADAVADLAGVALGALVATRGRGTGLQADGRERHRIGRHRLRGFLGREQQAPPRSWR